MTPARVSRRAFVATGLSVPVLTTGLHSAEAAPAGNDTAEPPTVLPAVQHFQSGGSQVRLSSTTRIVLQHTDLTAEAELLAEDLVAEGQLKQKPPVITGSQTRRDDIVLRIGAVDGSKHPEAYSIVTHGPVTITSRSATGIFWGTRTLIQALRTSLHAGTITDWPQLSERALLLDIGRKYFSPAWIKTLIREMSFVKMNTLQLHISEGSGFRVECESHPEIVSKQHLTKTEVREILAFARRYHVQINADVDTPGHMDHILSSHPELRLVLANGTRHDGFLDFSKPRARRLVHRIVGEMCDLFDGPVFHLGGDEFFPAPWQGNGSDTVSGKTAPQLVEYAQRVTRNRHASAHDGYEFYLNEMAKLVRAKGKKARVFSDDVYPGEGVNQINSSTEVDAWVRWNDDKPDAGDLVDAGHQVINSNGDYLYFILTSDGLGTGPNKNPEGIYERWTPRTFMGEADKNDYILPDDQPLLGAHLSVWCDSPDAMTQDEVAHKLQEWLQVFAQQTWGSAKPASTLKQLRSQVLSRVGTAPQS